MEAILLENALIPIIQAFGGDYFYGRSLTSSLNSEVEISAGFGTADVVFFQLNNKVINDRKKRKLQAISSEEVIKTLLLIKNRKKVSVTYLASKLPFSENELKYKVLRFLENHALISKIGCGDYRINYRYAVGLDHSVAIEAKIKDWKRGLYQAYRYRWFADASYLALYKDYIKQPKKNIHLFKNLNVGLLSVTENNIEEILYRPKKKKPQSLYMKAVVFEKLLERIC